MVTKIEINLTNKWIYSFIVLGVFLALCVGVWAYNSNMNSGNPSVMGHSSGEINVNVGGMVKTLQQAIDDGDFSASSGGSKFNVVVLEWNSQSPAVPSSSKTGDTFWNDVPGLSLEFSSSGGDFLLSYEGRSEANLGGGEDSIRILLDGSVLSSISNSDSWAFRTINELVSLSKGTHTIKIQYRTKDGLLGDERITIGRNAILSATQL